MKGVVGTIAVLAALAMCAQCAMDMRGIRAGMPAPRILYGCTVTNLHAKPVVAEVRYAHPFKNMIITANATLMHGATKAFLRREFKNDGAVFAAPVSSVAVRDVANPDLEQVMTDFDISSPTPDYLIQVVTANSDAGFELVHPK